VVLTAGGSAQNLTILSQMNDLIARESDESLLCVYSVCTQCRLASIVRHVYSVLSVCVVYSVRTQCGLVSIVRHVYSVLSVCVCCVQCTYTTQAGQYCTTCTVCCVCVCVLCTVYVHNAG